MLASLIPFRFIAYGLIALAIVSMVAGGYAYLGRLHKKVTQLEVALSAEQSARQIAEDSVAKLKSSIATSQAQIDQLEAANRQINEEWATTLAAIDNLDTCLPGPPEPTPTVKSTSDAVDRLNRTNADVNRMLERIGQ